MAKTPKKIDYTSAEVRELIDEISKGDDRVVAILCGAVIDNLLELALTKYFIADPELCKEMFGPSKPLSAFSAKIDLCRLVGLIGPTIHSNLHYIREIRNKFAHVTRMTDSKHVLSRVTFNTQQIAAWCQNIEYSGGKALMGGKLVDPYTGSNRERFVAECVWLVLMLKMRVEAIDGTTRGEPILP